MDGMLPSVAFMLGLPGNNITTVTITTTTIITIASSTIITMISIVAIIALRGDIDSKAAKLQTPLVTEPGNQLQPMPVDFNMLG